MAAADIHLQGMQHELEHRQSTIPLLAQRHEISPTAAGEMNIARLLRLKIAFPLWMAAARLIVVTAEKPGFLREGQSLLDRLPEMICIGTGEIRLRACRFCIRAREGKAALPNLSDVRSDEWRPTVSMLFATLGTWQHRCAAAGLALPSLTTKPRQDGVLV